MNGAACRCEKGHDVREQWGAGRSILRIRDPGIVFDQLDLREGDRFLDLGCGSGDYAMAASRIVGRSGAVFALEKSRQRVARLVAEAADQDMDNVLAMACDISRPLPVGEESIDVCLLATVLHIPEVARHMRAILGEVHRVLRPGGRLGIIECKKEETAFGPPPGMRLSARDIREALPRGAFHGEVETDLGGLYLLRLVALQL
ncbi:class I SAM-dependent methyltransferase [Pelobacter propionicus]|uniref:Methyltransferase type 11 n=1 Tax=Pelobacter propionicus (strain DSM 2379 / NBRC 103807 / OttBd1) TaxID=338966 RepID=A1AQD3_PELPD|nr:methyltransferase domain-containing protein [Pelobacter propionicus]ABK99553.1 Methyltransferase type 11 [Pelobacter propionicus DSM 2379]